MKDQEKELLVSISGAMREFAGGALSLDAAKSRYRDLRDRYRSLGLRDKAAPDPSLMKSLCYDHNISNYSLLSGMLSFHGTQPRFVFYYGDDGLAATVQEFSPRITAEIRKGNSFTLAPEKASGFPHSIHCSEAFMFRGAPAVILAVTSSKYFAFNRLIGYSVLLQKIAESVDRETRAMQFDCHHISREEIHAFLDKAVRDDRAIIVQCFYFGLLDRIFSHLGLPIIMEISEQIVRDISSTLSHEGRVIPLSIREYIAFIPEVPGSVRKAGKKPLELRYKGVTIPYEFREFPIRSMSDRVKFWELFSIFIDEQHAAIGP